MIEKPTINTDRRIPPGRGWLALSPVIVFLLL